MELGISIAKSGALINLFALNSGRTGRQYRKYLNNSIEPKTLLNLCARLGLVRASYTREVFTNFHLEEPFISKEEDRKVWEKSFEVLRKKSLDNLIKKIIGEVERLKANIKQSNVKGASEKYDFLRDFLIRFKESNYRSLLERYSNGSNYEIGHPFKSGIPLIYGDKSHEKLYSWEQVKAKSIALLDQVINDTDSEYAIKYVSTHGRYLVEGWLHEKVKEIIDVRNNKISIEVLLHDLPESYYRIKEFNDFMDRSGLNKELIQIDYMNWWTNNRDLLLILKKEDEQLTPHSAIYMYRGSTTVRVSPILVTLDNNGENSEVKEHLAAFYRIFRVYQKKAKTKPIGTQNYVSFRGEDTIDGNIL